MTTADVPRALQGPSRSERGTAEPDRGLERELPPFREKPPVGLHRFACLTAGSAFFLLFAGGMVTSTGSGLAVPDWPLSFGTLFPSMAGGVFFEHGHRLVAGAVGLMTLALAAWVARSERNEALRALAAAAAAGILVQAGLGGLTVLLRLPPAVSIAHACLGQAVFCLLLALAQLSSPWYKVADPAVRLGKLWRLGAGAVGAVYLQLVLGAVLRHTGQALMLHMAWALPTAGHLLATALKGRRHEALAPASRLLLALVPLQLGLGVAAYLLRWTGRLDLGFHAAAALVTAHVAVGAGLLGASLLWTLRAYRIR